VPQTDTNTETGGCMYGEGLLMMSAKFLTRQCRRQTQTQKLEAVCTMRDS
jgi:hypothetical protein